MTLPTSRRRSPFHPFTAEFSSTTSGLKTAVIHIANDDADENPTDIALTAQALSPSDDTDGDGLNDAAEFLTAALGYDWRASQVALLNTLISNANVAGLYTQPQYNANYPTGFIAGQSSATGNPNTFNLWTLTLYDANRITDRNDVINNPNTYSLYTLTLMQE